MGSFELLSHHRFGPLFGTQFLGAFNDSIFRNALIILLAFSAKNTFFNQDTLINFGAALFVIPYFLFSALAGQLADKFEKSRLIRLIKLVEVFLAALAVLGFYLGSLVLLLSSLFLLGTHATFFGPLKYSILPQHLKESELLAGNGLVEMGTFIAILLGTMLGGILIAIPKMGTVWVSATMGMAALLGLGISLFIPEAPACAPTLKIDWNIWQESRKILKATTHNPVIFYSIIGVSWFWLYGSMFLTQIANYTKLSLGGTEAVATLMLTTFSVGIGMGSVLCDKLSNKKIEMGLVPFGALGLTLFALDLSLRHSPLPQHPLNAVQFLSYGHNWRIITDAFLMGVFGGFYLVPLYTIIQKESKPEERSRNIAANNILNALFMTAASIIAILFLNAGFSIPALFFFTAILNAVVALYIFKCVPAFLMRFLVWALIHTLYRVIHEDLQRIPKEGPAVLVYNSTNFFDVLILLGVCPRPIRFVVDHSLFKIPLLQFILKTSKAIPTNTPNILDEITHALEKGELVAFSLTGSMHNSLQQMVAKDNIPVIPVILRGMGKGLRTKISIVAGESEPALNTI